MKVKSESEVTQSCLTLSDPMDCSLPGSFVHGIFQAIVLEWVTTAFSTKPVTLGKLLSFSRSQLPNKESCKMGHNSTHVIKMNEKLKSKTM